MSRIVNAVVGAVVAVVFSFIPFSTLLGGTLAGFLEGPDGREGLATGALSGLLTLVPFGVLGVVLLSALSIGLGFGLPIEGALLVLAVVAILGTLLVAYTVGASALGGLLGAALAREYPETWAEVRRAIGSPVDRRTDFGSRYEYDPIEDRVEADRESEEREYDRFER